MPKIIGWITGAAISAVAGFIYLHQTSPSWVGTALAEVTLPPLSGDAAKGQPVFETNCSACHGQVGQGINGKGPPLIHKIYEPGHHGDAAFVRAIRDGVRGHHWPFGDMPPVARINDQDIRLTIEFVRAVQVANGIQ